MTGTTSFSLNPPVARIARTSVVDRPHGGEAQGHPFALEVGDRLHWLVLAHPEGDAQAVDGADQSEVRLLAGRARAFGRIDYFEDVGDAELGLATPDQRNKNGFAGGGLNENVYSGFLLQHLGDRRARRVVERAGLHGGDAECLRQRASGGQRERRSAHARERGAAVELHRFKHGVFLLPNPNFASCI